MKFDKTLTYHQYLHLDRLLDAQKMKSAEAGAPAHDEMLFIITHQTYELWFKQILTEIDSILDIFKAPTVAEREMGSILGRLVRITEIQRVLISQLNVLETMTPLDFLEFRDHLYPASGFQSVQFRLIENKLGLKQKQRLEYNHMPYHQYVSTEHQQLMLKTEQEPSLFEVLEKWLERTPFLQMGGFDFWNQYQQAVRRMLARDRAIIENNPLLLETDKAQNLKQIEMVEQGFAALFDEPQYLKLQEQGHWRMSYKALHAALLIQLYRDEPALQLPHRLLTALIDIDEQFTLWRYRHALMVLRMLGTKIGTGGSSGHSYLRSATDQHKVFSDLFNLATYYIPRSELPTLPPDLQRMLNYTYTT
jgi:tryptophan 2,3-dioxygenase